MIVTKAIETLIQRSDPINRADEREFLDALEAAAASLSQTDLSDNDLQTLIDILHSLEEWWLTNQAAWGPRYLVRAKRGLPDANQTLAKVNRLREKLRRMLPRLASEGPSTDAVIDCNGITAKSLMNEADIKKDTWRRIVNASDVRKTRPGEHSRRFSFAEIRKLAAAAEKHCPRIGAATARCWLEMVERNLKA